MSVITCNGGLPIIQEGQMSVTGKKYVHKVLINCLKTKPAQENV